METLQKTLKDKALVRWGVLLLISVVMFASYYFYDVYSGIKNELQINVGLNNSEYGQMVGFYSFANFFFAMTIIGGIVLDKLGIRKTGFIFIGIMVAGALITAYGASDMFKEGAPFHRFLGSFWKGSSSELKMMIIGRLLFGLGAETTYVTINKIMVKWFKGKELALAFGINLAVARFGTAAAFTFSPKLVSHSLGWTTAGWFGGMLMIISLVAFVFFVFFDMKLDKQTKIEVEKSSEDDFRLADLGKLFTNTSFIFVTLLCVTFYSAVFPFLSYAPDFLHNKFGFNAELSGQITTILPYGTVLFTPLFGWVTDKWGKSASLMVYGSLILVLVHLTFATTMITPYIPLFLLGIAFSLVPAAMWPSVAKIVEEKRLGTAYGVMFFIQNIGLWGVPILMGLILDKTNPGVTAEMVRDGAASFDYSWAIVMLAGFGILGIVFAFMLKRADRKSDYGLELPNKQ